MNREEEVRAGFPDGDAQLRKIGKLRDRARLFKHNPGFEALLELGTKDPAFYEGLEPQMKMTLGFYEMDRSSHEEWEEKKDKWNDYLDKYTGVQR
jgi:hypothetical protein